MGARGTYFLILADKGSGAILQILRKIKNLQNNLAFSILIINKSFIKLRLLFVGGGYVFLYFSVYEYVTV